MKQASGYGVADAQLTPLRSLQRCVGTTAVRIGLETGPLTTWLWTALTAEGLPMVCLDARHAKKALDMKVNKTDANDAEGLAHLVRAGWYREVRVKSRSAMLAKRRRASPAEGQPQEAGAEEPSAAGHRRRRCRPGHRAASRRSSPRRQ